MKSNDPAYESLDHAIVSLFMEAQTPLIPFDVICERLAAKDQIVMVSEREHLPLNEVSRRQIHRVLTFSGLFDKAGGATNAKWALKPKSQVQFNDNEIYGAIESALLHNGPINVQDLATYNQADFKIYSRYISMHQNEFETRGDGKIWFCGQPAPSSSNYNCLEDAIVDAIGEIRRPASVTEIYWYLCRSTVNGVQIHKSEIEICIRSHNSLFIEQKRGYYDCVHEISSPEMESNGLIMHPSLRFSVAAIHTVEDVFNPEEFFATSVPFTFA